MCYLLRGEISVKTYPPIGEEFLLKRNQILDLSLDSVPRAAIELTIKGRFIVWDDCIPMVIINFTIRGAFTESSSGNDFALTSSPSPLDNFAVNSSETWLITVC